MCIMFSFINTKVQTLLGMKKKVSHFETEVYQNETPSYQTRSAKTLFAYLFFEFTIIIFVSILLASIKCRSTSPSCFLKGIAINRYMFHLFQFIQQKAPSPPCKRITILPGNGQSPDFNKDILFLVFLVSYKKMQKKIFFHIIIH